ncbi:hypothetical protein B484DRAFT_451002 [Ochromonadaceae sp. CCMP2298]|nr:hypothetical protein B484DRAFT_451002 [Ochromonadaceae sp. CCMP2298]|mmetsp:Transcript_13911/g.30690  ORF Transcript_13911/g.30690 Transcript_13911/m.30690 type:complete len:1087 (-) Transcript_13911:204-3464(-)
MSLLKQIEDKGAVLEWSPVAEYANLVALGTKDSAGAGFDDHGGELELHSLDFADARKSDSTLLGKARANARFASIAWSQMATNRDEFPYGLIAGGMADGNIHVWDPSKLAGEGEDAGSDALLASVEQHAGAVSALHFNPHRESSHLLASGGSDAEVFVTSLEAPDQPSVFVPAPPPNNAHHTADITKVAWNSQVAHILASAAQNGSCYIWDLRQKKAWCELRDPSGGCVADIAWNPDQGLHFVTASGDDKNPVLKLWDLRSSTSLPLATLSGHKEGLLSVSWCPNDASLLLSCAKDNSTILWDLFTLQPVYELPSMELGSPSASESNMFGGGLASSAGQRRYHVSWSPCLPAVVAASSFDRRVQFFSMTGAKSRIGRAPKWLRRPVGATFGFGGKLVTFDSKGQPAPAPGKKASYAPQVKIHQVVEDGALVQASDLFHSLVAQGEYKQFCDIKAGEASAGERQVWSLMNVICFGSNAREELLSHLGFDSAAISATAQQYVSELSSSREQEPEGVEVSAEDAFGTALPSPPLSTAAAQPSLPADVAKTAELWGQIMAGEAAEPTVRRAIVVGNFEAAVECCLEAGLLAEALLLAQCGDQALRVKTQAAFFEKRRHQRPFLNVLHAVIKSELMGYVLVSDLLRWRETLALLSTYGKSDEFPALCEALAARLEEELRDTASATLCYMCAANVLRAVGFWTAELQAANEALGRTDTAALQSYVEKVVVFTHANPVDALGPECAAFFATYAELLANQGRLQVALSYMKGHSLAESVLIDRLYHAGEKAAGSRPPAFPFEKTPLTAQAVQPAAVVEAVGAVGAVAAFSPAVTPSTTFSPSRGGGSAKLKGGNAAALAAVAGAVATQAASVPMVQVVQATAGYVLPAGWLQLVDPTSSHPYYVNQASGQSQWEAPPSTAAPVPSPLPTPGPEISLGSPAFQNSPALGVGVAGMGSMTRGGGLASAASPLQTQAQAESPTPAPEVQLSADLSDLPCLAQLQQIIASLTAAVTSPTEKKQMGMVQAALEVLQQQVAKGEVAAEVQQKLSYLVEYLGARNFAAASQVQTDLANTVWGAHKDWIKGIKILNQLAAKK